MALLFTLCTVFNTNNVNRVKIPNNTFLWSIMTEKPQALKSKTKKIYKSNKLNKASFADFNLNDYRVYLNAIALVGGVTPQGKYMQPDELSREYTLSALDFARQFNIASNNAYKILKQAVKKLMKTDITIEKPELFQTWQINVCERAIYNENDGSISILFTGSIMEYLKQRTKNFTLYNLNEITELTSLYAVRLYELVQQFNTTTGFLIHTMEQWRNVFGISQEQYKMYHQIKQKVFLQAMNEINVKTGYQLTMTEEKEGRKVVRVRFDFTPDKVQTGLDTRTGKLTTRVRKPRKPKQITAIEELIIHQEQQELEL
jgi:plasmid replication initiation protein